MLGKIVVTKPLFLGAGVGGGGRDSETNAVNYTRDPSFAVHYKKYINVKLNI